MKWTDRDITPASVRPRLRQAIEELATRPGQWAEVDDGRYPPERVKTARSRGSNIAKRHPGVQYAVEQDGNEYVLYLRVPA